MKTFEEFKELFAHANIPEIILKSLYEAYVLGWQDCNEKNWKFTTDYIKEQKRSIKVKCKHYTEDCDEKSCNECWKWEETK